MAKKPRIYRPTVSSDEPFYAPIGFTVTDNRIEDYLQRHLSSSAYCVWRQYLRYWGRDRKVAYPSLSTISLQTGLSEKTIRTANKELVEKGFLKYKSGCSNRSNQYKFIDIESLMIKYYGYSIPKEVEDEDVPPITQEDRDDADFKNRYSKFTREQKDFYTLFTQKYHEKMLIEYVPSKNDMRAISKIENNFNQEMLTTFFYCRNKYIEASDYTIYFFLRPKTQQIIISEFNQTDIGRWVAQAEKYWTELKEEHIDEINDIKNDSNDFIYCWIGGALDKRLSGSNTDRDAFIANYLVNKIKSA